MEWSKGVADAISTCKLQKTPLLVLVEPPASIVFNTNATNESAQDLYARVATNSLHDRLFEDDGVLALIQRAGLLCVRLTADNGDFDYVSFSTFFKLDPPPPNLFLISPETGSVLFQAKGYVSPVTFATQLARVVKLVSNQTLPIPPKLKPKQKRHNPFGHLDFASADATAKASSQPQQFVRTTTTEAGLTSRGDAIINGTASSSTAAAAASRNVAAAAKLQNAQINSNNNNSNNNSSMNNNNAMKLPQAGGHARLRARLPDGRQVEKRFIDTSPFRTVRTWLATVTSQAETNLLISLQFPRRVLTAFDDPKQLIELDLTPSASLIVMFGPGASSSPPSNVGGASLSSSTATAASDASAGAAGSSSGWRAVNVATSAFGVVSSFVRSFVNPEPSGLMTGTAGGSGESGLDSQQQRGQQTGSANDRGHTQHWQAQQRRNIAHSNSTASAATPAALQMSTMTPAQPQNANLRHRRVDNRNANGNNDGDGDDDRQWLSNGNSTQFGWNPSDMDKDGNEQE